MLQMLFLKNVTDIKAFSNYFQTMWLKTMVSIEGDKNNICCT